MRCSEAISGGISYLCLLLIASHPFMTEFQLHIFLLSMAWLVILGACIFGASGLALNFIKNESSSYFFWGALLGISSAIFVFWLNISFSQEAQEIQSDANQKIPAFVAWAQERSERLSLLKEFIGLLVSVFGGGISGNLIVSAIAEHRKAQVNRSVEAGSGLE